MSKKIMIVDDEVQITTMLEKALSRSGNLKVTSYNNPNTALSQMGTVKPDLVLLDIMMPQMDGITVLGKIKEGWPAVKVIMMTAYSSLDKVLNSHKIGADQYILKPFESLHAVEAKVTKTLEE